MSLERRLLKDFSVGFGNLRLLGNLASPKREIKEFPKLPSANFFYPRNVGMSF